jgi:cytochrome c oxidase assembly factor CtaG
MPRLAGAAKLTGIATVAAAALTILVPGLAIAHGSAPGAPDASTLITGWSFDVMIWLPLVLAAVGYVAAVRKVNREHPLHPVPRKRLAYWLAGLGVLLLALQSPIERYDTTLFSVHMVQHLLLTMVAAPLLALAGPITLLLRVATPDARKRILLPFLHSRPIRVLTHPVVAWVVFTGFMFASHFSPLFDAALEDAGIHMLEHALYLGTAMLFWWPAVGVDPSPWRLRHGGRLLYLGLGMPWSSFLGLAIFSANDVLYRHYATLQRSWGFTPLEDQAWAGGIMWAGGDAVFLLALVLALARWLRAEEVEGKRLDARADRETAAAAAALRGGGQ